jgi:hypothetical protein
MESRNKAALDRLQMCLEQPFASLDDYPTYNSSQPFEPIELESTDDRGRRYETLFKDCNEGRPRQLVCPPSQSKLALTPCRWYFSLAYADPSENPGETVWLRNQINVLYELGYTVLANNGYPGMIEGHAALPDVISLIWTEDVHTLTCQDDPRCALYSEFKATNEKYPGTDVRADHTSSFWDEIPEDSERKPAQRWAWTWPELHGLPSEERGTIPVWKLFTTTYVSISSGLRVPS